MKDRIITIASAGAAIGCVIGLIAAFHTVIANRFIQYGMTRLAVLQFSRSLGAHIAIYGATSITLYGCAALLAKILRLDINKRPRFEIAACGLLLILFIADRSLAAYFHSTIFSSARHLTGLIKGLIAGKVTPGYFFYFLELHAAAKYILVGGMIAGLLFVLIMKRVDVRPLTAVSRKLPKVALVLVLAVALLNAGLYCYEAFAIPRSPSVILISVDALRPDHMGCYGYARETSPHFDLFAKEAVLFESCFAHAPHTSSSVGSILSGFLPHETGVTGLIADLPPGVNTLAELLRNNGYATAAVVSNYALRKRFGFDQGFDLYDDEMTERESVRRLPERVARKTTKRAIEVLQHYKRRPFFLWIHYQDPHGPYTPPAPFDTLFPASDDVSKTIPVNRTETGVGGIPSYQLLGEHKDTAYYISRYDGEIRYCDKFFGQLIDWLKGQGLYDKTVIVVTADHGEGLGEGGFFFAHSENLSAVVLRVPLLVKYTKTLSGTRKKETVQHADIVPTILAVIQDKPAYRFRGKDLLDGSRRDRQVISEKAGSASLIAHGMQLIRTGPRGEYRLFDARTDPAGERDLLKKSRYHAKFELLKKRMEDGLREDLLMIQKANEPVHLDDDERKKLKSLGYVQ